MSAVQPPLSLAFTSAPLLIKHGVDANAKADDGKTALMYAAKSGDVPTITSLIEQGAQANAHDRLGATALMYAAREGHAPAVAYMLNHGANVDEQDQSRWTALTWAVKKVQVEMLKRCLQMLQMLIMKMQKARRYCSWR